MTSLVIEHFDMPLNSRDVRALGVAGERAGDALAGRTVWCAAALPTARPSAQALRARLDGAGPGVAASPLEVAADEPLRALGERLDRMLSGAIAAPAELRRADRDLYAEGARGGEALVGDGVSADDVVVVHDALTALLAQAVRERGAHAVWRFRVGGAAPESTARRALEFLQGFTSGVDAYVLAWHERGPRGELVERVVAAMPSADLVAAMEFPTRFTGDEPRRLAWRMALAEIVRSDRDEHVGGTLHARPTVAAR